MDLITKSVKFIQFVMDKNLVDVITKAYSQNSELTQEWKEIEQSDKSFEGKEHEFESLLIDKINCTKMVEALREDNSSQELIKKYRGILECGESIRNAMEFYKEVYTGIMLLALLTTPIIVICAVSSNPIFYVLVFLLLALDLIMLFRIMLMPQLYRFTVFLGYKALGELILEDSKR